MADFSTVVVQAVNQVVTVNTTQQVVSVNSSVPGSYDSVARLGLGWKSVKDPLYGAVGGGVMDDATAINAALAGGGYVFFPLDTYATTTPLLIPSNTVVDLGGSTIIAASSHTGTVMTNSGNAGSGNSNITVKNGTVDGNKANRASGGNLLHITCLDNGSTNTNIRVENLYAHDSKALGIILSHVRGGSVKGVHAANNERDGLTFYFDCQDITVDDVWVHDCKDDFIGLNAENSTSTGHTMKRFTMSNLRLGPGGSSQGSGLALRGCKEVEVNGVVINEGFAEGIGISNWNTSAAEDITITGGSAMNSGLANSGGTGFGVSLVAARGVSSLNGSAGVSRVRVNGLSVALTRTYGVRLINSAPSAVLIRDVKFNGVTVTGTTLNTGSRNWYGDTDGVEDVSFTDCSSYDAQLQGWFVTGVWKRTKFTNCRAFNSGLAVGSTSTSAVGFSLVNCVDTEFVDCTATDTQVTKTQRNGIRVTTCTGSLVLIGNDCRGNDVSSFSLNDTAGLSVLRIRDNPGFSPWAGQVSVASGGWSGPTTLGGIAYYTKDTALTYAVPFPTGTTPLPVFTTNVTGVSASALSGSETAVTVRVVSQRSDGPAVVVYYNVEPSA